MFDFIVVKDIVDVHTWMRVKHNGRREREKKECVRTLNIRTFNAIPFNIVYDDGSE